MKKHILATVVALLMNTVVSNSAFGQQGFHGPYQAQDAGGWSWVRPTIIEYDGETFELVALRLSNLHLTGEDQMADVLKMGRILGLRPFTKETRIMVDPKTLEPFTRGGRVFFAREPFTRNNETLWIERFEPNGFAFVPIGDINRGPYATIKWFYRDGDIFLFLRAIHKPKH